MTPFTNGDSNFPTWGENGRAETLLLEWVWGRGEGSSKKRAVKLQLGNV